ncbi:hypothetical protein ACJMK2_031230 [Sinanodonta woodiana]|uniref:Uncharacterized protein n=1 Tax=Sinanodonta woodiana TaxID=1069815 RepID=A0ABD3WY53_SINWO
MESHIGVTAPERNARRRRTHAIPIRAKMEAVVNLKIIPTYFVSVWKATVEIIVKISMHVHQVLVREVIVITTDRITIVNVRLAIRELPVQKVLNKTKEIFLKPCFTL